MNKMGSTCYKSGLAKKKKKFEIMISQKNTGVSQFNDFFSLQFVINKGRFWHTIFDLGKNLSKT